MRPPIEDGRAVPARQRVIVIRVLLADVADQYARIALANIAREFPAGVVHRMTGPGDFPRPRERNPAFYGSYDWHSCVEMHWLLVRLLRVAGDHVPQRAIRAALNEHLARGPLAAEARFMANPVNAAGQRPYGWGWALTLAHEVGLLGDADATSWAANLAPLAEAIRRNFLTWLAKSPYPVRYGVHPNSAFGVSRALPYATARDPALAEALRAAALRWFVDDADYPGGWEPSGHDFLSPALAEAELMAQLLDTAEFSRWLTGFLPGLAEGEPASLFTPAHVADSSDGQTAHLHGLNLSRAWCWRRLADVLGPDDPRTALMRDAAKQHAEAAFPHVAGDDYMVEHWLACYALLYLTG